MRTRLPIAVCVLLTVVCFASAEPAKALEMPLPDYPDTVLTTVPVGPTSFDPCVTPNGEFVYVPNLWDNTVSVIRTSDNTEVVRFALSGRPSAAVPSPDGQYVYISLSLASSIARVRISDNAVVGTIATPNDPWELAISPDGEYLYAGMFRASSYKVAVIRLSNDSIVATPDVGNNPWGLAVTPDGAYLYVALWYENYVSVLRTADYTVVDTIPTGIQHNGLCMSTDGQFVYVAAETSQAVYVIRTSDNTVVASIPVPDQPTGVALLPNGRYLYVANYASDYVSVIRTSDFTVVKQIRVGTRPDRFAVLPDGSAVYVATHDQGYVAVLGNVDVGAVAILSPNGIVDSGTVHIPRAFVRNFGPTSQILPVTINIGAGYAQTVQETLASRTSDTVVFPSWTAGPAGTLAVTCFTSLVGDEDPTNDTIRDSVRVVGPTTGNVGAISILSPSGVAESGSVVVPIAVVHNFGLTPAIFPVTMNIGTGYDQTLQETLASGVTDTVAFPSWTAGPVGTLPVACFTSLAGDEDPANDTIRDTVTVHRMLRPDVGLVAILSPPEVAESGLVYVPQAVVRSYDLLWGVFPVTMEIGSGYARTIQETLAVTLDTVVFPAWTAGPPGALPITCFASLLGDRDPANDTIRDSIQVVPPPWHNVGAVAIVSPSGSMRAGDTVIPKASVRNFGNRVERYFDVRFRIGTGYNEKVNVTDALPAGSTAELAFPPWVAEAGNWAVSCSTMLGSDENRDNDKVSSSVQVFPQSLAIEPNQSDQLPAGQSRTYRFYALIQGDTGGVVEVARPSAPPGWNLRLGDAAGANDLTDTDEDGIPDLGYVAPGESGWFSLDVTAPSRTQGDTASLSQFTIPVAGHVGGRPDIADTAALSLTLLPAFSVHNFPNPFSDHTTFVIGLPEDGKTSLTVCTRDGARISRVLANADLPAGVHLVRWDGVNDNGRRIAPGTYEYLLDYVHAGKTDRIRKRLVLTRQ